MTESTADLRYLALPCLRAVQLRPVAGIEVDGSIVAQRQTCNFSGASRRDAKRLSPIAHGSPL